MSLSLIKNQRVQIVIIEQYMINEARRLCLYPQINQINTFLYLFNINGIILQRQVIKDIASKINSLLNNLRHHLFISQNSLLKKNMFSYISSVVITVVIVAIAFYFDRDYRHALQINTTNSISKLNHSIAILQEELRQTQEAHKALASQIQEMHLHQLSKQEKNMKVLKKYSRRLNLTFSQLVESFETNYRINKETGLISKLTKSYDNAILYSLNPIPNDAINFFEIKIQRSRLCLISIGIFTHQKLISSADSMYSQNDQMYYINGNNGKIYHGQSILDFFNYKETRMSGIKEGDVVSVFIDRKIQQITFYINEKYAQSEFFSSAVSRQELYPFLILATKDDEILIMK